VGIEATGHSRWFERFLRSSTSKVWIRDPAKIRAKQVRKQKTDRRDAEHILKMMMNPRRYCTVSKGTCTIFIVRRMNA